MALSLSETFPAMRFTLATMMLVILAAALSVGWWIDSTRSRNEIAALNLRCQQIDSLQVESGAWDLKIHVLKKEIEFLKRRENLVHDVLPQLVSAQCNKSQTQIQALGTRKRMDELMELGNAIRGGRKTRYYEQKFVNASRFWR